MAKTCQLFSGSGGNSILISNSNSSLLVDAGVSAKRLDTMLHNLGFDPKMLDGIFVTHEHTDHISGIKVFAKRHNIPVFAHRDVLDAMDASLPAEITRFETTENMELNGIEIIPFLNSHDSVLCQGYRFNLPEGRSISVCTDTGYVTDDARKNIIGSDMVYLESNHEITMLQNGFYPYQLKKRILSDKGHLSNFACAEFATELVQNGTTRITLAHLSKDNNTPDIARQTTISALQQAGFLQDEHYRLAVSAVENFRGVTIL